MQMTMRVVNGFMMALRALSEGRYGAVMPRGQRMILLASGGRKPPDCVPSGGLRPPPAFVLLALRRRGDGVGRRRLNGRRLLALGLLRRQGLLVAQVAGDDALE